ncbi:hypothetical protein AMI01nite_01860 [Aneurinibacillus migulanus]|nr:hypothetical protein AMI01nite_01860 [Aneurinibacillus migulanus]
MVFRWTARAGINAGKAACRALPVPLFMEKKVYVTVKKATYTFFFIILLEKRASFVGPIEVIQNGRLASLWKKDG